MHSHEAFSPVHSKSFSSRKKEYLCKNAQVSLNSAGNEWKRTKKKKNKNKIR